MNNTNNNNNKLHPQWITGFTDAEGSFGVYIYKKDNRQKTSWEIKPRFSIHLHARDTELIKKIQAFFNCGRISESKNNSIKFEVGDLSSLVNIIIPHFDQYSLITQKQSDFLTWKMIIELKNSKQHLTLEGLNKIVSLKATLNLGLSIYLINCFPNIIQINRSKVNIPANIDPNWFAGFMSGEGCFFINITKSSNYKLGYSIVLRIMIGQNYRDKLLIEKFLTLFNCGNIRYPSKNFIMFTISKFDTIYNKLIPFFKQYPVEGIKYQDFLDFCEIAELMKNKKHLTLEGLAKIQNIKARMNKNRYIIKNI